MSGAAAGRADPLSVTPPDPKVLCVTYQTNDLKVGDVVTVTGGYSRPNPDFIVLDPCLAQRPEEPVR